MYKRIMHIVFFSDNNADNMDRITDYDKRIRDLQSDVRHAVEAQNDAEASYQDSLCDLANAHSQIERLEGMLARQHSQIERLEGLSARQQSKLDEIGN